MVEQGEQGFGLWALVAHIGFWFGFWNWGSNCGIGQGGGNVPRRARVVLPGVALHLVQRGNNRTACFFAPEDYRFYLDNLAEMAFKHGCAIHAYCLMTNHVLCGAPHKKCNVKL